MANKSRKHRYEANQLKGTVCLASLATAAGLVLGALGFVGLRNDAIATVDRLVAFDERFPPNSLTSSSWQVADAADIAPDYESCRTYKGLIVLSVVSALSGILGLAGALTRQKGCVCTYVVLTAGVSCCALLSAVQLLEETFVAEPLIQRQVLDLCNATTYIPMALKLHCPWTNDTFGGLVTEECNEVCNARIGTLRHLGGCHLLPKLCTGFAYSAVPAADCRALLDGVVAGYPAKLSQERCQEECDRDVVCVSYVATEAPPAGVGCLLLQGMASLHTAAPWGPAALNAAHAVEWAGNNSATCFRRTQPLVLLEYSEHSLKISHITVALGLLLVLSTCCQCCLMYDLNIRREGQPNAWELFVMLCCPFCSGRTQNRFHVMYFDRELGPGAAHDDWRSKSAAPSCCSGDEEDSEEEEDDENSEGSETQR